MQLAKENSLSALEQAIADAKKQCDEASANECASAWDTVEELSAAIAHKKAQVSTPPTHQTQFTTLSVCIQHTVIS